MNFSKTILHETIKKSNSADLPKKVEKIEEKVEEKIKEKIKEVEFLKRFVKIESVTGNERAATEFLVRESKLLGFSSKIDAAGNFVGVKGSGKRSIVLLGHIDTVPGKISVVIKNRKLYGRGSVDAKGPFTAFLFAAAQAIPKDATLTVIGAVEEEGNSKGAHFVKNNIKPDFIIIGEPSGSACVTLGYRGALRFCYTLKKIVSHGAGKENNAYDDALEYYYRLKEYCLKYNADKSGAFSQISVYLVHIKTSDNGLFQEISLDIRFRIPVSLSSKEVLASAESLKGLGKLSEISFEEPIKVGKNTALVKVFLQAIRSRNLEPRFTLKTGTSDMNILGNSFHVPIVTYGPGDSSLDHTPDEHIALDEFIQGIEILTDVLNRL